MRHTEKRNGPATNGTASTDQNLTRSLTDTLPPPAPAGTGGTPALTAQDATALTAGAYVVVVQTPNGHPRRRVLLSLSAAERHAHRARDRGQDAHVILARLAPVGVIV